MNTNDFIKRNLIDSFIQKGKQSAKIGEIRMYGGKPYQKQADGRWLRNYGSESEPKKEEPKKDSLIGKEITYTKKYAYGKEGQVTAKVVAVKPDGKVLLSSGDETHTSIIKLKDEKESKKEKDISINDFEERFHYSIANESIKKFKDKYLELNRGHHVLGKYNKEEFNKKMEELKKEDEAFREEKRKELFNSTKNLIKKLIDKYNGYEFVNEDQQYTIERKVSEPLKFLGFTERIEPSGKINSWIDHTLKNPKTGESYSIGRSSGGKFGKFFIYKKS